MRITATINDAGKASLTTVILNSTTTLEIADAQLLGDDLAVCLDHTTVEDIHRDAYSIALKPNGVEVITKQGRFDIPWQHIKTTSDQLNA